jgi:hypothetical protein
LLGVSSTKQDCGAYCAGTASPYYYANGVEVVVAASQQLTDPVTMFGSDNNGVLLSLPSISSNGATSATGTLTFGIDTQSDNTLSALGLTQYQTSGNSLSAMFGSSSTSAIFDSGSPMYYFSDAAIPKCSNTTYYCPGSDVALSLNVSGENGTQSTQNFSIRSAATLLTQTPSNYAFSNIGEDSSANASLNSVFDMGLTFFFGRSVGFVFDSMPTYEGQGPAIVF